LNFERFDRFFGARNDSLQNLSFATPNPSDLRVSLALAEIEGDSINDYVEAKSDCITKILEEAKNKKI
jgi:hypothetical protein